jgi:hypothetical protein
MSTKMDENRSQAPSAEALHATDGTAERRAILKKLGRFAAVSAPAVTLLLAATLKPKKAAALY